MALEPFALAVLSEPWSVRLLGIQLLGEKGQVTEGVDGVITLGFVVAIERPACEPLARHHMLDSKAASRNSLLAESRQNDIRRDIRSNTALWEAFSGESA